MEDAVVLDVGVASDGYAAVVAAQDGAGPDAGVFAEGDVADDICGLANEGGGVNVWGMAVEASNHDVTGRCNMGGVGEIIKQSPLQR